MGRRKRSRPTLVAAPEAATATADPTAALAAIQHAINRRERDGDAQVVRAYGPKTHWRCVYCAEHGTTRDHIVPKCQGGHHGLSNSVPSCERCNVKKADKTLAEWFEKQPMAAFCFLKYAHAAPPTYHDLAAQAAEKYMVKHGMRHVWSEGFPLEGFDAYHSKHPTAPDPQTETTDARVPSIETGEVEPPHETEP